MSLAKRLSVVQPSRGRRDGCATCLWLNTLPEEDRAAFYAWVDSGASITQMWEIASTDPDNPITVGISAMRLHIRTCPRDES